jgi:small subunit ribosomal protein S1
MSQQHSNAAQAFIAHHAVGDVLDGRVVSLVPFGAFVELAHEVHGLLHRSEWTGRPAPGEALRVEILAVDPASGRLSLRTI